MKEIARKMFEGNTGIYILTIAGIVAVYAIYRVTETDYTVSVQDKNGKHFYFHPDKMEEKPDFVSFDPEMLSISDQYGETQHV